MGLENLQSIFNEGIDDFPTSDVTTMTSVYTEGIGGLFNKSTTYVSSKFTPMSSLNVPSIEQILTSGNTGGGYITQKTSYDKLDITNSTGEDVNVSGISIRTIDGFGNLLTNVTKNRKFPNKTSWSDLYDKNHKSKGVGYNYGSNVRSVFSIRDEAPNVRGLSRAEEPYIISNLPSGDIGGLDGGRLQNFASRSIPIVRAVTDAVRLTKYLSSPQGILNIGLKNLYSVIPSVVVRDNDGLMKVPQRFKVKYNPLSTILSAGSRLLGEGLPNVLFDRTEPGLSSLFGITTYSGFNGKVTNTVQETFERGTSQEQPGFLAQLGSALTTLSEGGIKVVQKITGDKMTLAPMIGGITDFSVGLTVSDDQTSLSAQSPDIPSSMEVIPTDIESKENGMPFYFKDLRDNTYIFFRAYIDGLTENISPSWASTNYLGRSEPVYVYERSERDISFNLKLFSQTESELTSIYQKINRLTSLCYPEYKKDIVGGTIGKQRMKPPLTKFRLGELFGSEHNEMLGFIKTLSYTHPQESPWETKAGKRVPKYVQVAISYQVIHIKVPSLDFAKNKDETFYGINKAETGVGVG